jgi:YidC/Oxa1 family membrane protein insertase
VNVGSSASLDFDYYVGPKEFKRLQALGNRQDEVMQFGFLSFISKLLLSFMYAIHSVVPSWGWSTKWTARSRGVAEWRSRAKTFWAS